MGRDSVKDFANMGRRDARKALDAMGGPDTIRSKIVQTPNGPVRVRTHGGLPRSYPLGAPAVPVAPAAQMVAWPYGGLYRNETGEITTTYGHVADLDDFSVTRRVARLCSAISPSGVFETLPAEDGADERFSTYQLVYSGGDSAGVDIGEGRYIIPRIGGVVVADMRVAELFSAFSEGGVAPTSHDISIEWYEGDRFYWQLSAAQKSWLKDAKRGANKFRLVKKSSVAKTPGVAPEPTSTTTLTINLGEFLDGKTNHRQIVVNEGLIVCDISPDGKKFVVEFLARYAISSTPHSFPVGFSAQSLHCVAWSEIDVTDTDSPTVAFLGSEDPYKETEPNPKTGLVATRGVENNFYGSAERVVGYFYDSAGSLDSAKLKAEWFHKFNRSMSTYSAHVVNSGSTDLYWYVDFYRMEAYTRAVETTVTYTLLVGDISETISTYENQHHEQTAGYPNNATTFSRQYSLLSNGAVIASHSTSGTGSVEVYPQWPSGPIRIQKMHFEGIDPSDAIDDYISDSESSQSSTDSASFYFSGTRPSLAPFVVKESSGVPQWVIFGYQPFVPDTSATPDPTLPLQLGDIYTKKNVFGYLGFLKLNSKNYISTVSMKYLDNRSEHCLNLVTHDGKTSIGTDFSSNSLIEISGGKHPVTGAVQISDKFISWV